MINKIVIGTVQFGMRYGISNNGNQTTPSEAASILKLAATSGIYTLDTAFAYGTSETLIGNMCLDNNWNIISKFPAVNSVEDFEKKLHTSLHRLQKSSLYGYIAHDADTLLSVPEIWKALCDIKRIGLATKIGYSLYEPEQLTRLLEKGYEPDIVQIPYNVLDRRFEPILSKLKSCGVEVHIRSIFLQGLFFTEPDSLPTFFDQVKPFLRSLKRCFSGNAELAGYLLNMAFSNPLIDKVVIGVNNAKQLLENLKHSAICEPIMSLTIPSHISQKIIMPNHWPKS